MDRDAPGCLTIPLLIVIVPVRLLWEVLSAIGRFAEDYVMRPIGRLIYHALVRPLRWTLRVLLLRPLWWVLRVLVALPARWVHRNVLVPLGRVMLRYVLIPLWTAFAWLVPVLAIPFAYAARWLGRGLAALWRAVLGPALAAFGRAIAYAWRLAGVVLFHLVVRPVRFVWRVFARPVPRAVAYVWRVTVVRAARWTREHVWEPTRVVVRSLSRALGLDARRP